MRYNYLAAVIWSIYRNGLPTKYNMSGQDEIAVWVPSTSDCLANDWRVLT